MLGMLDYKLLEALHMVVTSGGFEKAAQELHLTQSAISQRVKLLEEQTGQVLLARRSPPRPSPAGRLLLKHFSQVARLEQDLAGQLRPRGKQGFNTISLGINADSLATWFMDAVRPLIKAEKLLLDLRVDDQEQTHRFLRDGEVLGCVSAREKPIQGCRVQYLGRMDYRLVASPEFAARWFPHGLNLEGLSRAPGLIFNRKDELHARLIQQALGALPPALPSHFLPSSERFVYLLRHGLAYGPAHSCGLPVPHPGIISPADAKPALWPGHSCGLPVPHPGIISM